MEENKDKEQKKKPQKAKDIAQKIRRKAERLNAEEEKHGIIYISRVPMFMKVEKLRYLMSEHGEVGRIYLNPETVESRKKRIKSGGNRKTKYIDGWVEFMDKRIAKLVALSLNNTPIGGKKRFYAQDLWNIKYLPKFKWHHLTERIAVNRAEREALLRDRSTDIKKSVAYAQERIEKAKQQRSRKEVKLFKKEAQSKAKKKSS
ncbi:putative pre-rRNA-processing protein ESF2 [Monocercomonoides exilis]|uniref:putative pre-rRNA-processing protein ESF2 n=1 Tax=Monocercomonoides exilis TaxID=2049356 RepID=UPI00355A10E7|nr:putative pre-rRNA-processing protein ESF2 [Monocercomonoides exilis]|eukprot:MONOS_8225.1-p1 / transcript=MONOS_8225.1 / gene=MONOS_8225 / organism=Monocercomonoides_exilis_PA203 / gene_product=pre-rRNA-processing protein ESF2 / transcript_product=pre-rRNA-processing protein ESF2 / location=Mono_scaffold00304:32849-33691(+) / protein_length=202 / sequence_SO=supercontig / SO=protein_coding / is_pseudo=false